jgi:hypothetical protein
MSAIIPNVSATMQKMLGIVHLKKDTPSQPVQLESIRRVAAEFEKVYTSINKLNSSVNEGTEQMASYMLNIKKKLQDLKKAIIQLVRPRYSHYSLYSSFFII